MKRPSTGSSADCLIFIHSSVRLFLIEHHIANTTTNNTTTNKQAKKQTDKQKQTYIHTNEQTDQPTKTNEGQHKQQKENSTVFAFYHVSLLVGWFLNVPATCQCISGRICSDNFTCCHTETEVADPSFHLTQSQYTDTGPTSPSADFITPGARQGSHWSAKF